MWHVDILIGAIGNKLRVGLKNDVGRQLTEQDSRNAVLRFWRSR